MKSDGSKDVYIVGHFYLGKKEENSQEVVVGLYLISIICYVGLNEVVEGDDSREMKGEHVRRAVRLNGIEAVPTGVALTIWVDKGKGFSFVSRNKGKRVEKRPKKNRIESI